MRYTLLQKTYPSKWKRHFALFPQDVGKRAEGRYVWLEFYEKRYIKPSHWQIRECGSDTVANWYTTGSEY